MDKSSKEIEDCNIRRIFLSFLIYIIESDMTCEKLNYSKQHRRNNIIHGRITKDLRRNTVPSHELPFQP